ncbi:MAG: DUF262 domain-containing protein [Aureispira sp.]
MGTKEPIDLGDGTEKESEDSGSLLMEHPFDPLLIRIETKTPSLDTLIKRIARESILMNTDSYFQRKDNLWNETMQSRLIESILIRFPLPAFFFDASDDDNWLVVDGLQRLSSIRNFVVNKTLRLKNLEFLPHLDGSTWDDIPENLQRIIEEAQVVIYKILPGTPTDVKFNIFKRINTGGITLESQEIRHALFQGVPATFIEQLAKDEYFITVTNKKIKPHRMLDREFANRFLCFYLLGVDNYGTKDYGYDIDTFMSKALAELDTKTETERQNIASAFSNSMNLAYTIFGTKAFRKIYKNHKRTPPINKALFDALSTQLARLNQDESAILERKKDVFKKKTKQLIAEDNDFFASITSSTGDKKKVLYRHHTIQTLIQETITQL